MKPSLKKSSTVLAILFSFASAIDCPHYMPIPYVNALATVVPIYDPAITQSDTDCDGLIDSIDGDIDGDGLSNVQEQTLGTNAYRSDSDGDGVDDKNDAFPTDSSEASDTDGDGV